MFNFAKLYQDDSCIDDSWQMQPVHITEHQVCKNKGYENPIWHNTHWKIQLSFIVRRKLMFFHLKLVSIWKEKKIFHKKNSMWSYWQSLNREAYVTISSFDITKIDNAANFVVKTLLDWKKGNVNENLSL